MRGIPRRHAFDVMAVFATLCHLACFSTCQVITLTRAFMLCDAQVKREIL